MNQFRTRCANGGWTLRAGHLCCNLLLLIWSASLAGCIPLAIRVPGSNPNGGAIVGTYDLVEPPDLISASYMLPGAEWGVIRRIQLRADRTFVAEYRLVLQSGSGVSLDHGASYKIDGTWTTCRGTLLLAVGEQSRRVLAWPNTIQADLLPRRIVVRNFGEPTTLKRR